MPKSLPLVPLKSSVPSKTVALKLPMFCETLTGIDRLLGPVRVNVPLTVALMVEGELVLVFSTRMSLLMEPALLICTDCSVPSAGLNWLTNSLRLKSVAVTGTVIVCVRTWGLGLTLSSWLKL